MDNRVQRESFILRVWWKREPPTQTVWIQHIGSGEGVAVHDLQEAAAFMERWVPLHPWRSTGQDKHGTEERQGLR